MSPTFVPVVDTINLPTYGQFPEQVILLRNSAGQHCCLVAKVPSLDDPAKKGSVRALACFECEEDARKRQWTMPLALDWRLEHMPFDKARELVKTKPFDVKALVLERNLQTADVCYVR